MLAVLIALAIGYGIAALLKKFAFKGQPISWPMAFAVGTPILIISLAIAPKIFDMSGAAYFPPLVVAMLIMELTQGYKRQAPIKSSHSSVESKPKEVVKPITEPTIEPTSRPAENPKKKEPVEKEKSQMSKAHNDEKFFEQVAAELEEGSRKKGLWLKAETKAKGDADRARLLYVEWRVEQLTEAEDEARRQKEEAELEAQREEAELEAQREEKERQRLVEEERQRLAEEALQQLTEEERERLVEEKKRSGLIQPITTQEEANECIAPLVRYGYSVQMTTFDNAPSWRVIDRNGKSRPVAQSELKLYVYDQIKLHGYDTTIRPCEKCGGPMVEIAKAVWKCKRCNPN